MAAVWPGQIVEENAIQVHISALRKALDEDQNGTDYIATVPGRGYRLIDLAPSHRWMAKERQRASRRDRKTAQLRCCRFKI